jgi:hypothetical protein
MKRIARTTGAGLAIAAAVALGVAAMSSPAQAQRKKITLDELVIEGNIQKPEAFFILPRTNLNFEDLERREDLKSRIVKSVEKAPF